jgi:hypothetical protein
MKKSEFNIEIYLLKIKRQFVSKLPLKNLIYRSLILNQIDQDSSLYPMQK